MAEITINIGRPDVFDEVNKASAYIGSKSQDKATYARIALTAANNEQLAPFWDECCAIACGMLQRWLVADRSNAESFSVVLRPSEAWNASLEPSVKKALRGYLINGILAKWLMITDKSSVDAYAQLAAGQLADAENKMHRLAAPSRP